MTSNPIENRILIQEMDEMTAALKEKGIDINTNEEQITGLGDIVQATLNKVGITEERFKQFFGIKSCNCEKRKQWLNKILSWKEQKNE
jgi:hypothetical protein